MGQNGYVLHYMILNRLSIQIKCLPGTDIYCSKATTIWNQNAIKYIIFIFLKQNYGHKIFSVILTKGITLFKSNVIHIYVCMYLYKGLSYYVYWPDICIFFG